MHSSTPRSTADWTPDQFWEYAAGLTDAHICDQLRETLAERGLMLTSTEGQSRG